MTSSRTEAYGRVVKTLAELGPVKLHAPEIVRIREASDTLLFAVDAKPASGIKEALADIESLAAHLSASGRWTTERAARLVDDVLGCGPLAPVA